MERPDCDRKAWEDSGLPSLRAESQVKFGRKYHSAMAHHQQIACGQGGVVVVRQILNRDGEVSA